MACAAAMRRRLSWKRPAPEVEDHKVAAASPAPELYVALGLFEALDIGLAMVLMSWTWPVRSAVRHRVLRFGFADDLLQVGQAMALGIGLPVVLKAHHLGLVIARPGDELERARADGVVGRRVEGVGRHQAVG